MFCPSMGPLSPQAKQRSKPTLQNVPTGQSMQSLARVIVIDASTCVPPGHGGTDACAVHPKKWLCKKAEGCAWHQNACVTPGGGGTDGLSSEVHRSPKALATSASPVPSV